MADVTMKRYLVSYGDGGDRWNIEIHAESPTDAMRRLAQAAAFGNVDGEVIMSIPAALGPVTRIIVWILRTLGAGRGD